MDGWYVFFSVNLKWQLVEMLFGDHKWIEGIVEQWRCIFHTFNVILFNVKMLYQWSFNNPNLCDWTIEMAPFVRARHALQVLDPLCATTKFCLVVVGFCCFCCYNKVLLWSSSIFHFVLHLSSICLCFFPWLWCL